MGSTETDDTVDAGSPPVAATVSLPGDLGIEQAAALKALLMPVAAEAAPVLIDGAAVERLHASALQMLAAVFRDRRDAGLQTGWSQASAALTAATATLGLSEILSLDPERT